MSDFRCNTADGFTVRYQVVGDGPPMLLVHGWGADADTNWRATGWVETLSPLRQLILLDVRGHGASDKPHANAAYSYAAMANDVLAVIEHLQLERCDFIGYSMGAFIGAYLLGHHADCFRSMVLGGIGDETRESAAAGVAIADALRASPEELHSGYGWGIRRFVEALPHNDLEALAHSAVQMWPEGYPRLLGGDALRRADLPVLVVNGDEDHPYVDTADAFVAMLPKARHLRIAGTDHLATVADKRFKAAVVAFLGDDDTQT